MYYRYVFYILQVCYLYITSNNSMLFIYYKDVIYILPVYYLYITSMLFIYYKDVIYILQVCYLYTTSMLFIYYKCMLLYLGLRGCQHHLSPRRSRDICSTSTCGGQSSRLDIYWTVALVDTTFPDATFPEMCTTPVGQYRVLLHFRHFTHISCLAVQFHKRRSAANVWRVDCRHLLLLFVSVYAIPCFGAEGI